MTEIQDVCIDVKIEDHAMDDCDWTVEYLKRQVNVYQETVEQCRQLDLPGLTVQDRQKLDGLQSANCARLVKIRHQCQILQSDTSGWDRQELYQIMEQLDQLTRLEPVDGLVDEQRKLLQKEDDDENVNNPWEQFDRVAFNAEWNAMWKRRFWMIVCCVGCPASILSIVWGSLMYQRMQGNDSQGADLVQCIRVASWNVQFGVILMVTIMVCFARVCCNWQPCPRLRSWCLKPFVCILSLALPSAMFSGTDWVFSRRADECAVDGASSAYYLALVIICVVLALLALCVVTLLGWIFCDKRSAYLGIHQGRLDMYRKPHLEHPQRLAALGQQDQSYAAFRSTRFPVSCIRLVYEYMSGDHYYAEPVHIVTMTRFFRPHLWICNLISEYACDEREFAAEAPLLGQSVEQAVAALPRPHQFHVVDGMRYQLLSLGIPKPILTIVADYVLVGHIAVAGGVEHGRWQHFDDDAKTWPVLPRLNNVSGLDEEQRESDECRRMASVQWFDVATNRWCIDPDSRSRMLRTRVGPAITSFRGQLVVCGGLEYLSETERLKQARVEPKELRALLKSVERYDIAQASIQRNQLTPTVGAWRPLPPMPVRCAHAAAIGIGNSWLYIIGGIVRGATDTGYELSNQFQIFSWESQTWQTRLLKRRMAHMGICTDATESSIYLVGGHQYSVPAGLGLRYLTSNYLAERCVFKLDVLTDKITYLATLPTHRAKPACVMLDNKLIVIGGYTGFAPVAQVDCLDLSTLKWSVLPDCNVWYPSATVIDDILYVMGYDENLWFSWATGRWNPLPLSSSSHPRRHFTAVSL